MMRKTGLFIFIAVLLITLFFGVACDSTPVSVPTDNSFVEVNLSVNNVNSRAITINGGSNAIAWYKIALIPEWNNLSNGAPIYGRIGSRELNGTINFGVKTFTSVDSIEIGYVTPGKWTVYVAAFNSDGKIILDGYSSTYINSSNNTLSVTLSPYVKSVTEKGTVSFDISVPVLSTNNHIAEYGVKYTIYSSESVICAEGTITGVAKDSDKSFIWYQTSAENNVSLSAGNYIINTSLVDKATGNVIGGVTRQLNVVAGSETTVSGSLSPSEFIEMELDYQVPIISADVEDIELSFQIKDNAIIFTCTDLYNNTTGFNRIYRWFIDGEMVTSTIEDERWNVTAISDNDDKSSITCVFKTYGRREVRCEVVYIPVINQGESDNKERYVGGDSTIVKIIPRKTQ